MQVRPARLTDVKAIDRLVQHAYEPYVARIGLRPAPMDDDYEEKVSKGDVFVAIESEVVGVLVLVTKSDHLLLENVAVDTGRQGQGIGRSLLTFAEAHAREIGMPELRLYTNAAMSRNIELYLRLGYEEVDRRGDGGYRRVFFIKQLEPTRLNSP